ncbi:MAG: hypothetical protein ABI702_06935 [Burkholderiales bacterium]
MSGSNWQPPEGVPTLTEVVAWPAGDTMPVPFEPAAEALPLEGSPMPAPPVGPSPAIGPSLTDEQMIELVLADVQHQVDLMLEYRLREVLAPILTRATDAVVREARGELASTLRDVVARAVAQEMTRHRSR